MPTKPGNDAFKNRLDVTTILANLRRNLHLTNQQHLNEVEYLKVHGACN